MQVLGLGRQSNLVAIVDLAEAEYRRTHGTPASLVLKSAGVEIEVERGNPDGPFERWSVRLKAEAGVVEAVRRIAGEFPESCTTVDSDGGIEFRCSGASADDRARPLARMSATLHWPETWHVGGTDPAGERISPERLFRALRDARASDIHLLPGARPVFRIDDRTCPAEGLPPVSRRQIERFLAEIAPESALASLQRDKQTSFPYRQVGLGNSRVSAFVQRGVPHCTIRYLPERIPSFDELRIPAATMQRLAEFHEGLVLVCGMTGSGKSTTVASLLDWMNETRSAHILTIESPIEFVHANKRSIVSQRNVGTDSPTAVEAVRGAIRHDPDVIFIGEMQGPDSIRAAIDAAGTGRLVVSTFHANSAAEVANRVVSFFDPSERDFVRLQLRDCIRCVLCQRLVPRLGGGRVPALEFLFNDTSHIGDCILSGHVPGLRVAMQQSTSSSSIIEESLLELVRAKLIDPETAHAYATNADAFEQMRLGTYAVPSLDSMHVGRSTR